MENLSIKARLFFQKIPPVTFVISAICIVAWLFQIITSGYLTQLFSFNPIFAVKAPWRYITAAFLHDTSRIGAFPSPLHLIMNMYSLWIIGPILERTFGAIKFAILYLFSAIGGHVFLGIWAVVLTATGNTSLVTHTASGGWLSSAIGASGAVFGLLASLICLFKKVNMDITALISIIILNLIIPFFVTGIAWQAHLGGLIVGLLITYGYVYLPERIHILQQKHEFEKIKKQYEEEKDVSIDESLEDAHNVVEQVKENTDTVSDAIGISLAKTSSKHSDTAHEFAGNKKSKNRFTRAVDSFVENKIMKQHKKSLVTAENAWIFSSAIIFVLLTLGVVLIDLNAPFIL